MNTRTDSFLAETPADWTEVGRAHPHESAIAHVCGSATYTDDPGDGLPALTATDQVVLTPGQTPGQ